MHVKSAEKKAYRAHSRYGEKQHSLAVPHVYKPSNIFHAASARLEDSVNGSSNDTLPLQSGAGLEEGFLSLTGI